jgi:hypothetical protein
MNFSSCWRWDSTRSCYVEVLEELVRTVCDVDDGVLLEDLDELLQLLEVGLHPRLPLPLVERVREQGEALVGLVHQRPVTAQPLQIHTVYAVLGQRIMWPSNNGFFVTVTEIKKSVTVTSLPFLTVSAGL